MRSVQTIAAALAIIVAGACTTTGIGTATAARDQATFAIPLSTQSALARAEFLRGVRALNVERVVPARQHFGRAVAADPNFALAHLYAAFAAPSLATYRNHLDEAIRLADRAAPVEQLWIRSEQTGLNNNVTGQLALAQQLVQLTPSDPRAYGYLAAIQLNAGKRPESRATLERAGVIAPSFASTWIQLGNSYLLFEPRNVARGGTYIQRAIALEPGEPFVYDYLGDFHRAGNRLEEARAAYSRAIELDPSQGGAYQQRGHVNSFLGNFADARADYHRAVTLSDPTQKTGLAAYRALVSVYEGNPAAADGAR